MKQVILSDGWLLRQQDPSGKKSVPVELFHDAAEL